MYVNLSGLNVLITGATRGIGKAIAMKVAEAGACVCIHYNKSAKEAESLANVLGNESRPFQADLKKPDNAIKLLERVLLETGHVDVLINNAGITRPVPLSTKDEVWLAAWMEVMSVNLTSSALLCKKIVEHFIKRKASGRIINITSHSAFQGESAPYISYACSKAGLVSLTRSLAREFGKDGVKAFCVAPGYVKSDISGELLAARGRRKEDSPAVALERLTEPKDIAPLITLIVSGLVDHATGSTFDINAGSYLH